MQVGRSIVGTIALFLVVLMASPVYDMYTLHQQKHKSAEGLLSQERRCAQKCSLTMRAGQALVFLESQGVKASHSPGKHEGACVNPKDSGAAVCIKPQLS